MGIYVNPNNADFQQCLQHDICVDKSMIIECINKYINTEDRFISISMPLHFGKSKDTDEMIRILSLNISDELLKEYPNIYIFVQATIFNGEIIFE